MGFAGWLCGGGQTTEDPDHRAGEDVIAARTERAAVREVEAGVMCVVRLVRVEVLLRFSGSSAVTGSLNRC